eukprot:scaffold88090_cov60-Phaeocystis_antarctica.AAC.2
MSFRNEVLPHYEAHCSTSAFTPIPPLTPVPCRSDVGCDKIDAMPRRSQGGTTHPLGAQGQAKTRPNPEVLMAG